MKTIEMIKNHMKLRVAKKFSSNTAKKRTTSIKLTIFLMRVLGLWHTSGRLERILSRISLSIGIIIMIYNEIFQCRDLYYSRMDVEKLSFVVPVLSLVTTEFSKMLIFIFNPQKVKQMNTFIDEYFRKKNYSPDETTVFNKCEHVCRRVITFYALFGQCVVCHYLLLPLFDANTDGMRKLPFTLPFDTPLAFVTPYYELFYFIQILGTLSAFFCTLTFASYLFTISLFTAAQFKILSQNLTSLCDFENSINLEMRFRYQLDALNRLKQCIKMHQMLISLTKEVEDLYCYILLGQMIGSAIEICFCALQILFVTTTLQRQILSFNLLLSCSIQLYLICYSSHEVYLASENVSRAVYSIKWFRITDPRIYKDFTLLIQIITHRTRRPCILSVSKIYPLTLQTFASVLKTSWSYFMVVRKFIK